MRILAPLTVAAPLLLAGCGIGAAAPLPTSTPVPVPTATPTPGFEVGVTARPTAAPTPTPLPTATPFRPPSGPYIALSPPAGPPVARDLRVRGAHLPPSVPVQLNWSSFAGGQTLTTTTGTNKAGVLSAAFAIPASEPGRYRLRALVNGATVATTTYTVSSEASMVASATPAPHGDTVTIRGVNFLPNMKLRLVAFPDFGGAKAVSLGRLQSNPDGKVYLRVFTSKLLPGNYTVRVWSATALGAQLADAYLEVGV